MAKRKMDGNLIQDIVDALEIYSFEKVCIFMSYRMTIQDMASCFALKSILENLGCTAEVVVSFDSALLLEKEFAGVSNDAGEKNRFLAVTVGCETVMDIENEEYKKTYVLFDVCAPYKKKGFGVRNYLADNASCSGEVIYNEFSKYRIDNSNITFDDKVYDLLYLSLIGGTRKYEKDIGNETMVIALKLIEDGADYKKANQIFSDKKVPVVRAESRILQSMVYEDRYAYAIVHRSDELEDDDLTIVDYQKALTNLRYTSDILVWGLFVDKENGFYDYILLSNEMCPYDVRKIAVKNNGFGTAHDGYAVVQEKDINKAIRDIEIYMKSVDEKISNPNFKETRGRKKKQKEVAPSKLKTKEKSLRKKIRKEVVKKKGL